MRKFSRLVLNICMYIWYMNSSDICIYIWFMTSSDIWFICIYEIGYKFTEAHYTLPFSMLTRWVIVWNNMDTEERELYTQGMDARLLSWSRPVTGWEGVVCTCWDISLVNIFCFLKTSILELGMVEHLKVRQECYGMENHNFSFIHKITKKKFYQI